MSQTWNVTISVDDYEFSSDELVEEIEFSLGVEVDGITQTSGEKVPNGE